MTPSAAGAPARCTGDFPDESDSSAAASCPTPDADSALMVSVVSLYGLLPVELEATAAVPRLNAQLLAALSAVHSDWDFLAISPEAKSLPGVEAMGVALPASARAKVRLSGPRVGRRLTAGGRPPNRASARHSGPRLPRSGSLRMPPGSTFYGRHLH